jgi:hypothetical protein
MQSPEPTLKIGNAFFKQYNFDNFSLENFYESFAEINEQLVLLSQEVFLSKQQLV